MNGFFPPAPTPGSRPIDENALCDWLADAQPGATLEYYRGHLGHDRMPSTKVLPEQLRRQVTEVASRVRKAAEDGGVLLIQLRHGDNDYSYLAKKPIGPRKAKSY
ncbi:conserved hypothetical protein [Magnetospirillum sp. LM-5]|uniref:hypothetical protein n=1 Tax=Magnetospirillum sp. LM-5 TaxID=2681466 RepID=UPI0013815FEA|nr:hypothetical protein [Magnetospirillum sp. LM-5]CAA7618892.1 conserved hypothetical protein [Magnetospirillum sp. LM-5]